MLRVLTLSTLFPDRVRPTFGVFVERQTRGLAALSDVELQVVAPIGVPRWPLSRHPNWRGLAAIPERETWQGLTVHRPRFPVLPGMGRFNPRALASTLLPMLRDVRRDFRFDVIDAEFFFPDGPAAVRLGRALGVPVSIKARGADIHHWGTQRSTARQVREAGLAADGMLAVSAALKADMIALGLPGERIAVHYTGVDLDRFRPAADRSAAKAALGVAGPLLLSVGALIPRKGHDLVIEAMQDLPAATLMIAGQGPERAALDALVKARGLGDRVKLLGSQAHDALPALAAAADVGVLVSASEGLANAWVEALACGAPIVIADVGGARELVDRLEAGRLVAREPAAIAAGVRAVLAAGYDPQAVRATAERFTWEANAAALRAHLTAVAAKSSR
ncbi:glycosyltransferase [uncultured Sphingomonas sp.]|uniref:glycosyltransferase n=1 Tax=uncultured Sphingomonas sp. TaxID=158754 RepID=UPI00260A9B7E|nr:glycosyltransferase [uncultured Sphingomonas sp.]